MRRISQLIHLSVLFLLISANTYSSNYYVDGDLTTGSNNGTSWANAWQSFSAINWNLIQPGDNIYISGGVESCVYYTGINISGVDGTNANRITVIPGRYSPFPSGHSGRVIIDGQHTTDNIVITSCNYMTFKGFECRNSAGLGVYVQDYCTNITLDSLYIHDMQDAGIFVNGDGNYGIDSTVIKNCRILTPLIYGGQTDGIGIQNAQRTLIYNNYVRQQNQDPLAHNDCLQGHLTNGYVIYNNVLISDSVNSPEGGGYAMILGAENTNSVLIYNNFMYMGGIWYADGADSRTMSLRWYDNDPMPPTWVIHNTIISNGYKTMGAECEYRGTFVNNILAQFVVNPAGGRMDAIFGVMGTAINPQPIDSLRNNLFYRGWTGATMFPTDYRLTGNGNTGYPSSWAQWTTTYGGTGIYQENPSFVDKIGYEPDQGLLDGELQAGSPAIDAGNNVEDIDTYIDWVNSQGFDGLHPHTGEWALPKTDIYGNPISNGIRDIGAFEYQSGPDLTPPRVTGATLLDSVTLVVNFSEALDQATAENENNYSITNNINVLNASLSGSKVTLQTSPHSPGSYIVTVVNVEDLAGNPVDPAHNTAEYEYVVLPPDTLVMLPVQNVEGIIIEPEHTPEKTIDGLGALGGDPDSRWAAEPMPEELTFDLGTDRTICKTKLSFYNWNAGRIYNYSISVSNDHNNWITIVPQSTSASNEEWTVDEFSPVDARYVRVHFINNNQSDWAGLWEGQIWGIDNVTSVNNEIPKEFKLFQNYPNPFNPSTTIRYFIPATSFVTLNIYDVLGNEVATLVNEQKTKGNYEVKFSTTGGVTSGGNIYNLPSGIYFYRLQAGPFVETKKMLLLK
jgi:hypothetical protein